MQRLTMDIYGVFDESKRWTGKRRQARRGKCHSCFDGLGTNGLWRMVL